MTYEGLAAARTLKGRSSVETRSAVLDLIRAAGTISRVDLARRSALTETTISKIVKELLASGLIVQAGYAASTGGKRARLLRLNDGGVYALGLTLDVTQCVVVLCGPDGAELARSEVAGTGQEVPGAALERLSLDVLALLDREGVDRGAIIGLGVAAAGRRGSPLGWNDDASLPDEWERFPLEQELERLLGLSVIRENDANCAALGEYWTSPESSRDFATVYMSHGIGCGIVINGGLYRGSSRNAGEIGHTIVDPDGLACWCGSRGCLETVASPRSLVRRITLDASLRAQFGVGDDTEFSEVYRRFTAGVTAGDEIAERLLAEVLQYFTAAVSNLVNTLDLDLVVLTGSGYAEIGNRFLLATEERLSKAAYMRDVHPVSVRLTPGGIAATALGAASVVLHQHLTPHRSVLG